MRKIFVVAVLVVGLFGGLGQLAWAREKSRVTNPVVATVGLKNEQLVSDEKVGVIKTREWNGFNSVKVLTDLAVKSGVSEDTVVMLVLLPLLATLISGLHYILGFSGYGIFMPTMIAVAFLATGVFEGLLLFAVILLMSLLSGMMLRRFKLHFWPARAISLMFISVGTMILILGMSFVPVLDMSRISIFPVLFMILLAEEFARTQLAKSRSEAKKLTLGTLILAIIGSVVMSIQSVKTTVLDYPGVCLVVGLLINIVVGSYTGMRLSEIKRFKKAIRSKKLETSNK